MVVSLRGLVYSVVIALGHNNDQGLFNRTFKDYISQHNIVGLGDRGYTHPLLLTPADKPQESSYSELDWSKLQSDHRSPVEIINSLTKGWALAAGKVRIQPEYQAMALHIIYCLVNLTLKACPLRLFPQSVNK